MFSSLHGRSGAASILAAFGVVAAGLGAQEAARGAAARPVGDTIRVSVSSNERQANRDSFSPALSAHGRFVAFMSYASDLVPGDTNGMEDVFVRDRKLGITRRASVSTAEAQGNERSWLPSISAGGRYVVFMSDASNLVPGDTNGATDVFVRDRTLGVTRRVSISSAEEQGNAFSGLSEGDSAISAGGRYVVFESVASNLVPDDTNTATDVFVRDRKLGTTYRVSVSSSEQQSNNWSISPTIGAGGRYVVFMSKASNLVPGDTNGYDDVFVRDLELGTTYRASVSSTEQQASYYSSNPAISPGGRYVVFDSYASDLVPGDTNSATDVFVRDRKLGITRRVSLSRTGQQSDGFSDDAAISSGGRYVVFWSGASNLVPGDTNDVGDVFVRDRSPAR